MSDRLLLASIWKELAELETIVHDPNKRRPRKVGRFQVRLDTCELDVSVDRTMLCIQNKSSSLSALVFCNKPQETKNLLTMHQEWWRALQRVYSESVRSGTLQASSLNCMCSINASALFGMRRSLELMPVLSASFVHPASVLHLVVPNLSSARDCLVCHIVRPLNRNFQQLCQRLLWILKASIENRSQLSQLEDYRAFAVVLLCHVKIYEPDTAISINEHITACNVSMHYTPAVNGFQLGLCIWKKMAMFDFVKFVGNSGCNKAPEPATFYGTCNDKMWNHCALNFAEFLIYYCFSHKGAFPNRALCNYLCHSVYRPHPTRSLTDQDVISRSIISLEIKINAFLQVPCKTIVFCRLQRKQGTGNWVLFNWAYLTVERKHFYHTSCILNRGADDPSIDLLQKIWCMPTAVFCSQAVLRLVAWRNNGQTRYLMLICLKLLIFSTVQHLTMTFQP